MDLNHRVIATKAKISRFILFLFCLLSAFISSRLIGELTTNAIGLNLGFLVWVFFFGYSFLAVSVQMNIRHAMEEDNEQHFNPKEFEEIVNQIGQTSVRVKYLRFLESLKDVMKRSGLSKTEFPGVFVTAPDAESATDKDERMKNAFAIHNTGIGKGGVIRLTTETVMEDSFTQDMLSFVLAHELGHHLSSSMFGRLISDALAKATKIFINIMMIPSLLYSLKTGDWSVISIAIGFLMIESFLNNLQSRYEEFQADAYASSLGFGPQGIQLFEYMEKHDIGVFPPLLEIFLSHPAHETRKGYVQRVHGKSQGFIPDSLEKVLYTIAGVYGAWYIFNQPSTNTLLSLTSYFLVVFSLLCLSNPDIITGKTDTGLKVIVGILASILVFIIPTEANLYVVELLLSLSSLLISLGIIFAKDNIVINAILTYFEATLLFLGLGVLLKALSIIDIFSLINTLL